ncbi:hypothetical protein [Ammoniphilus sp. 3BR4]|uniref:hypothetical protein n=1 Tax=Ammoniphilus sp. 3BR4 TaxID=3158265 RepID=UPI003465249D
MYFPLWVIVMLSFFHAIASYSICTLFKKVWLFTDASTFQTHAYSVMEGVKAPGIGADATDGGLSFTPFVLLFEAHQNVK